MLRKNTELEIPKENPFENDQLDREGIIFRLTNLIGTITQPFVISVEAPWGAGKTTFLRMWKQYLENQGYRVIYFNAWETDFSDDPLVSFIGELDEALNELQDDLGDRAEQTQELWAKTKKIGARVLKRAIPLAVQIGTAGILSKQDVEGLAEHADEISSLVASMAEEKLQDYGNEKEGIKQFRDSLAEIAQLVVEDDETKAPLVFIIDELDRCKPTYAIALLERIKHLFAVEGITFILAMDREQLEHSIKSVYGIGMDAGGYLRRFIDYDFRLSIANHSDFGGYLYQKFDFDNIQKLNATGEQHLFESISIMFPMWGFSLRDQEQIFTELNFLIRTLSRDEISYLYFLVYLVSLKRFSVDHYKMISGGLEFDLTEVMELLRDSYIDGIEAYDSRKIRTYKARIEAILILYKLKNLEQQQEVLGTYQGIVEPEDESFQIDLSGIDPEYAKSLIFMVESFRRKNIHEINYVSKFVKLIDELGA